MDLKASACWKQVHFNFDFVILINPLHKNTSDPLDDGISRGSQGLHAHVSLPFAPTMQEKDNKKVRRPFPLIKS